MIKLISNSLCWRSGCPAFVNADLIAAGLSPFQPEAALFRAGRLMLEEIKNHVQQRRNFAFETTLSGLGYARMIPRWRSDGYKVKLIVLSLAMPEEAIKRVELRVRQGGHHVPPDVICRRFASGLRNFQTLAGYAVLDALIGNTDRHHENWGLLRRREGDGLRGILFLAPSFDHATSLGRELLDERRDRFLAENRVGGYAEKGRGAIYWSEDERRGPSPLELVRRAVRTYPDLFRPAVLKLTEIDESVFSQIVERIPPNWITFLAREFTVKLYAIIMNS